MAIKESVAEVQESLTKLEEDIHKLLMRFEHETDLCITHIDLSHMHIVGRGRDSHGQDAERGNLPVGCGRFGCA